MLAPVFAGFAGASGRVCGFVDLGDFEECESICALVFGVRGLMEPNFDAVSGNNARVIVVEDAFECIHDELCEVVYVWYFCDLGWRCWF